MPDSPLVTLTVWLPGETVGLHPALWPHVVSPGVDALTVKHLRLAVDALMYASGDEGYPMVVNPEACADVAARLRRALNSLERNTD
jgi:hypothetical protein